MRRKWSPNTVFLRPSFSLVLSRRRLGRVPYREQKVRARARRAPDSEYNSTLYLARTNIMLRGRDPPGNLRDLYETASASWAACFLPVLSHHVLPASYAAR